MLSHTRMGVPYEYTHMGRPIRVWANIRIWGRTMSKESRLNWDSCIATHTNHLLKFKSAFNLVP